MTKFVIDDSLDAALADVATCTTMRVCSGDPVDLAQAITNTLATVALTPGDGNGDYVIADGDTSGRKLTVLQQSDIPVTATGTAEHVTLDDGVDMRQKTSTASLALTSGGTVTVNPYDQEIADPV